METHKLYICNKIVKQAVALSAFLLTEWMLALMGTSAFIHIYQHQKSSSRSANWSHTHDHLLMVLKDGGKHADVHGSCCKQQSTHPVVLSRNLLSL